MTQYAWNRAKPKQVGMAEELYSAKNPEQEVIEQPEKREQPEDIYSARNRGVLQQEDGSVPGEQIEQTEQGASTAVPKSVSVQEAPKTPYDYSNPLSIFDERLPEPKKDVAGQQFRRNRVITSALGNAMISMGDGFTLGAGGYPVKREFGETSKYIDDYLQKHEEYERKREDWEYKDYLDRLNKAYKGIDMQRQAERDRIGDENAAWQRGQAEGQQAFREQQHADNISRYDRQQTEAERAAKAREAREAAAQKHREAMDKKNLEQRQKEFDARFGDGIPEEINIEVPTSVGFDQRTITKPEAKTIYAESWRDQAFQEAHPSMFTPSPIKNEFGETTGYNYELKRGVPPEALINNYIQWKHAQETSAPDYKQGVGVYTRQGQEPKKEMGIVDQLIHESLNKDLPEAPEGDIAPLTSTQQQQMRRLIERMNQGEEPSRIRSGIVSTLRAQGVANPEYIAHRIIQDPGFIDELGQPQPQQQRVQNRIDLLP